MRDWIEEAIFKGLEAHGLIKLIFYSPFIPTVAEAIKTKLREKLESMKEPKLHLDDDPGCMSCYRNTVIDEVVTETCK